MDLTPRIFINADDFGWTDGHNLAVARAHEAGGLHRASLLANGDAFAGAIELARQHPRLGVGVHLTLSEGRPLLPPARLPNLCRGDGSFHDRVVPLVGLYLRGQLQQAEVQAEWRAQIERALSAGLQLTHLDSHKHVHMLPPLLDAAVALAQEYRVPYLRLPWPPLSLRRPGAVALNLLARRAARKLHAAGLRHADHFVGFSESGEMSPDHLVELCRQAGPGTTEIMVHPAVVTPAVATLRGRYAWARRYHFDEEVAALCDPRVAAMIQAS